MAKITCKFGGTSLADAEQIRKAVAIVKSDPDRRFVVPSAPGKRTAEDIKVTDLLLACYDLAARGLDIAGPYGILEERFVRIVADLGCDVDIEGLLARIRNKIRFGKGKDWIASRGEYICGRIMAALLGAEFVDPAEHIKFTEYGDIDDATYENLGRALAGDRVYIIPGFYGSDPDGEVKTFPRGGSDITGSVVARAVGAAVYENWTDVSGFLMTDPRIVPGSKPITEVTYRELRELSYMGANVLHDEAIFPVRKVGVPIHIKNTNAPGDPGTRIVPWRKPSRQPVIGIAGRKGFSLIHLDKPMMNQQVGFGKRVLELVASHGVSYEHTPTGIDTLGIIIKDEELVGKLGKLLKEIERVMEPENLDVIKGLALIVTVGEGMMDRVGTAATLFTALGEAGVNIRVIDQGSSEISIIVGVNDSDFEAAVKAIYEAFVNG